VTVTHVKKITTLVKIKNGESLDKVLASVEQPQAAVQQASASNNNVACVGWTNVSTGKMQKAGDWNLVLCAKVQ
jgi:ribosomal protein L12E/L44/L45/RPP1/RPP2